MPSPTPFDPLLTLRRLIRWERKNVALGCQPPSQEAQEQPRFQSLNQGFAPPSSVGGESGSSTRSSTQRPAMAAEVRNGSRRARTSSQPPDADAATVTTSRGSPSHSAKMAVLVSVAAVAVAVVAVVVVVVTVRSKTSLCCCCCCCCPSPFVSSSY